MPYVITVPDDMVPASVKKGKGEEKGEKPKKKPRQPNAWALFCKAHMHDKRVQAVPPRQRFGVLSQMYKARQ